MGRAKLAITLEEEMNKGPLPFFTALLLGQPKNKFAYFHGKAHIVHQRSSSSVVAVRFIFLRFLG